MTKVSSIVKSARYILADVVDEDNTSGWSVDRLIDLISEAQEDICKATSIFKREYYVPLA